MDSLQSLINREKDDEIIIKTWTVLFGLWYLKHSSKSKDIFKTP